MTPAVIVFEPAGVLFHYHPERRNDALALACGLPAGDVRRALFDSGFMADCDAGRVKPAKLVDAIRSQLGSEKARRLNRTAIQRCLAAAYTPNEAAIAWAKSLQPGCQLVILGNGHDLTRGALETCFQDGEASVVDHFRPVLFSADLGARKPSPKVFDALSRLLDQPAERVLLVDTDLASLTVAESMGFSSHQFTDIRSLASFWNTLAGQPGKCPPIG